jgi:hypothetical protein
MGMVTFATRVCKVLGVETMIGENRTDSELRQVSDHKHSYQCSWRSEPGLCRWRYCLLERRTTYSADTCPRIIRLTRASI